MTPQVSVVITTCTRPHLVGRAIASVLGQTMQDLELIVVVDGPEPATREALEQIKDPRLRIHERETRGGQASAINSGVTLARAAWVALLDDDDEWLPEKLEVQLRAAETSRHATPVVGCRFWARSERGDVQWPFRAPRPNEPICEYLFCRTRLGFGEGIQPTSMLLAPTELFRRCPMNQNLETHGDLDWLIRVNQQPGVGLELPESPAPLAIWNMQSGRDRMSNNRNWLRSHLWITSVRECVTPRAFAGFLLTWVSNAARSQRVYRAFPYLIKEAFTHGQPRAMDLAIYALVWGLPLRLRSHLSSSSSRWPWLI
jgi:glycosyltransferase involved in cell wall biosynthesis